MDSEIIIRTIDKSELCHLENFLYEAMFIRERQEKLDKAAIHLPELSRYIKDFGQVEDLCLVAVWHGKLIGAIWTRIFSESEKGFGYVDSITPELSMSVLQAYRHQGIGTRLLEAMIDKLAQHNFEQVSLSVDKINYALKLYQKIGFEVVESDEKSATMIKRLIK